MIELPPHQNIIEILLKVVLNTMTIITLKQLSGRYQSRELSMHFQKIIKDG
jgi:hypothetical protein